MSAVNEPEGPEFALAVRGYDRAQVDDYLSRLHEWLLEAQARTTRAEEEAAHARQELESQRRQMSDVEQRGFGSTPESIQALGDRVGRILQAAFDAAEDMKTSARAESDQLLAEAQGRARELVEEAERRSAELGKAAEARLAKAEKRLAAAEQEAAGRITSLLDDAHNEADRIRQEAQGELMAAEAALDDLRDRRARAVDELNRLTRYLSVALQPDVREAQPDAQPDGAGEATASTDADDVTMLQPVVPSGSADGTPRKARPGPTSDGTSSTVAVAG